MNFYMCKTLSGAVALLCLFSWAKSALCATIKKDDKSAQTVTVSLSESEVAALEVGRSEYIWLSDANQSFNGKCVAIDAGQQTAVFKVDNKEFWSGAKAAERRKKIAANKKIEDKKNLQKRREELELKRRQEQLEKKKKKDEADKIRRELAEKRKKHLEERNKKDRELDKQLEAEEKRIRDEQRKLLSGESSDAAKEFEREKSTTTTEEKNEPASDSNKSDNLFINLELGNIVLYRLISAGASIGYRVSGDDQIQVYGTSGQTPLSNLDITSTAATLRYLKFFKRQIYTTTGLGLQTIKMTKDGELSGEKTETETTDLIFDGGIGSRLDWQPFGLNLHLDWLGVIVKISEMGTAYPDEKENDEDYNDKLQTQISDQKKLRQFQVFFLRLGMGVSF